MKIYCDFDDVICETARRLAGLASSLFGTKVPYGEISEFDLEKSFSLSRGDYLLLMERAHSDEEVLGYAPAPFAVETLKKWLGEGHEIEIVTGRPAATRRATKEWLAKKGLGEIETVHLDKFGRDAYFPHEGERALTLEEFFPRKYDFAVEDSPGAFGFLAAMEIPLVAVYSRPWNASAPLPPGPFRRCRDWREIDLALGCASARSPHAPR